MTGYRKPARRAARRVSLSALKRRPAARAKQVAGRLCLDFANLVGGWKGVGVARDDRLGDYVDVLAWAWRAGLLDEAAASRLSREAEARSLAAARVVGRARRLRDAIHGIAWRVERGRPQRPADLETIARESRIAWEHRRLASGEGRLEWRLAGEHVALDAPLWRVAISAGGYFTDADLTRLHSCPGQECGWHFEDATRNRSRHWCDMGDCGNVAKVRRFRARQRARGRYRKNS